MSKQRSRNLKYREETDRLLEGGDDAAAEDAKEEPKKDAKEEEKKEEPKEEEEKYDKNKDPYLQPVASPCCCCMCVCSNEVTQSTTCCGCFPIKCGMICISLFLVAITVVFFVWNFWNFMNEYLHWWYTLTCLVILIPLLVAAFFTVGWLAGDSKTTRKLLYTSTILALVSIILLCIWNMIYLLGLYKWDDFYYGSGDIDSHHYTHINKKLYIVLDIFKTIVLLGILLCFRGYTDTYEVVMQGCRDI